MFIPRASVFVAGAVLAGWVVTSAVRTMVVPRALQSFLARAVFETVRGLLRVFIGPSATYERRDRIMALFGPISLLTLSGVWLTIVLAGFTCMFWSLGSRTLRSAFELSGSSLFTLGSRSARDLPSEALSFAEAGMGIEPSRPSHHLPANPLRHLQPP